MLPYDTKFSLGGNITIVFKEFASYYKELILVEIQIALHTY